MWILWLTLSVTICHFICHWMVEERSDLVNSDVATWGAMARMARMCSVFTEGNEGAGRSHE